MASPADAEALFAAHETGLLRYLRRAVGHAETARDLTQDVFVRIARSSGMPATDDERRAWVFRIARNLAIDHHRRHEVKFADSGTRHADAGGEPARPAAQDTSAAVNEALASLDPLDRDVFLLRETAGLSYAEIAAACDLTVSAVRSRIHRARLALREHLRAPIAAALQRKTRD